MQDSGVDLQGRLELSALAQPPSGRHAGTRLKSSATIPFPTQLLHAKLSTDITENGFPEKGSDVGIKRTAEGLLEPTKTTAQAHSFKLKLQDPELVKALADF